MNRDARERLCVALDVPALAEAEEIVGQLADHVGVFKVGMQLFTAEGPRAINVIRGMGGEVFLDLKYHDIPNTVAGALRAASAHGVEIVSVHASGGRSMMAAAVEAAEDEAGKTGRGRPKIFAVTVLTSLSTDELRGELNVSKTAGGQVVAMARLAQAAGVDGVIASPQEIKDIRRACGKDFLILTPGIRPDWAADKRDQKRTLTPREAITAGANYIVVGRPILGAANRVQACERVLAEISDGVA